MFAGTHGRQREVYEDTDAEEEEEEHIGGGGGGGGGSAAFGKRKVAHHRATPAGSNGPGTKTPVKKRHRAADGAVDGKADAGVGNGAASKRTRSRSRGKDGGEEDNEGDDADDDDDDDDESQIAQEADTRRPEAVRIEIGDTRKATQMGEKPVTAEEMIKEEMEKKRKQDELHTIMAVMAEMEKSARRIRYRWYLSRWVAQLEEDRAALRREEELQAQEETRESRIDKDRSVARSKRRRARARARARARKREKERVGTEEVGESTFGGKGVQPGVVIRKTRERSFSSSSSSFSSSARSCSDISGSESGFESDSDNRSGSGLEAGSGLGSGSDSDSDSDSDSVHSKAKQGLYTRPVSGLTPAHVARADRVEVPLHAHRVVTAADTVNIRTFDAQYDADIRTGKLPLRLPLSLAQMKRSEALDFVASNLRRMAVAEVSERGLVEQVVTMTCSSGAQQDVISRVSIEDVTVPIFARYPDVLSPPLPSVDLSSSEQSRLWEMLEKEDRPFQESYERSMFRVSEEYVATSVSKRTFCPVCTITPKDLEATHVSNIVEARTLPEIANTMRMIKCALADVNSGALTNKIERLATVYNLMVAPHLTHDPFNVFSCLRNIHGMEILNMTPTQMRDHAIEHQDRETTTAIAMNDILGAFSEVFRSAVTKMHTSGANSDFVNVAKTAATMVIRTSRVQKDTNATQQQQQQQPLQGSGQKKGRPRAA